MASNYTGIAILISALVILALLTPADQQEDMSTRQVPDIPLPQSPLCPVGSECAEVHTCNSESVVTSLEHETTWENSGSNRMMSSPHTIDITGDGILDIIVGTGIEQPPTGSIVALDGSSGELLWERNASQEMFASAQFADLNDDSVQDVILGGRLHELLAVSGTDGSLIWEFDASNNARENWYQFYTGQFIDDQDGDGVEDWLTANGGDPTAAPGSPRDNGYLMIISGATGDVIAVADTPDNRETYMSPLLYHPHPEMELEIIFGTGGETWDGGLWVTSISSIMSGDISSANRIISPTPGVSKGIMAPPSIADMNLDGIADIVAGTFDGRLIVIDGRNYSVMWSLDVKEYAAGQPTDAESWASPSIGYFSDDAVPDVAAHFVIGKFPNYHSSFTVLADGQSGELLFSEDTHHTSFTTPLAVDLNDDGRDEVVMVRGAGALFSENEGYIFYNQATILDTCQMNQFELYNRSEMSIGTPTIVDLDGDGDLELISTTTTGYSSTVDQWTITRIDLNATTPENLSWGAYLGTNFDGVFESDS